MFPAARTPNSHSTSRRPRKARSTARASASSRARCSLRPETLRDLVEWLDTKVFEPVQLV